MNNSPQQSNGWGTTGDTLLLLVVSIGCVAFWLWFLSLPVANRESIFASSLGLFTVVLMQPGIFLTYKIIASNLPLRKKVTYGAISAIVVGSAVPLAISNWLFTTAHPFITR